MLTVDAYISATSLSEAIPAMKSGGLDAAFFVIGPIQGPLSADANAAGRLQLLEALSLMRRIVAAHAEAIAFASTSEEAYRFEKDGRHAAFIGLSGGLPPGSDLSAVSFLRDQGISALGLCGASDNTVCGSALGRDGRPDPGLSGFGRQVIAECDRLGMVIDLANCSDRSFFEALSASRTPVIVSHAGSRLICDAPGNLTDEMIKAVADKGGVVMISLEPGRLVAPNRSSKARIADILDHVDHCVTIAGFRAVGIGSGFGSGGGVAGCGSPADYLNLTIELLRRGHGETEVEAIWGGNVMRVLKAAEQ